MTICSLLQKKLGKIPPIQGLSTWHYGYLGLLRSFLWGCPVHCNIFGFWVPGTLPTHPLPVMITKNVSKPRQMTPGGQVGGRTKISTPHPWRINPVELYPKPTSSGLLEDKKIKAAPFIPSKFTVLPPSLLQAK